MKTADSKGFGRSLRIYVRTLELSVPDATVKAKALRQAENASPMVTAGNRK